MYFYGWNQKDLAEILNISEKQISLILNNKVLITPKIAMLLESAFETSAQFWLNLNQYFKEVAEEPCPYSATNDKAEIFKKMPIREMQKKGWVTKDKQQLFTSLQKFWGTDNFLKVLEERTAKFKHSTAFGEKFNPYFAQTWIQKVVLEAKNIQNPPIYRKNKLEELAEKIHIYSIAENGIKLFVNELRSSGVLFLILPHLGKTYTDGAAYWFENNPIIALTGRFSRNDNFWFSLSHEIGHILLHEKQLQNSDPIFIDSIEKTAEPDYQEEEEQANNFAYKIIKYPEIDETFKGVTRISRISVIQCADRLQIHPGIIVGYLQYHDMISYRNFNQLKENIKEILEELQ